MEIMMNKFGQFLIFFVSCVFISSILYGLTADKILPRIDYVNKVSFQLAYLNYDDVLIVAFKENESNEMHSVNKYSVKKTKYLKNFSFALPCQYAPTLYFAFGESHPNDFAIANLVVNGKHVEINKLAKELEKIGYKVSVNSSVIYSKYTEDVSFGALNLYYLTDAFNYISEDELANYGQQENYLRTIYFFILIVFVFGILRFILSYTNGYLNGKGIISLYALVLYFTLFVASFLLIYDDTITNYENIILLLKNLVVIVLFPLSILLFLRNINKFVFVISIISIVFFLLIVGLDHFVQNIYGTRFLFSYIEKFGMNITEGVPFFINYVTHFPGLYFVLTVVTLLGIILINFKNINNSGLVKFCSFIVLAISICITTFGNSSNKSRYLNVFQVNVNGVFTDGDYAREYVNYVPYSINQLDYTAFKGLNQKKNVIVILVESLGCNVTDLCGYEKNYSPYTTELASNNIWFKNYYSNAFHTNGAIFSITTGYPLIASKYSYRTAYNKELYQYDLIKIFKENGYFTSYYSPASVLLEEEQIKQSPYDEVVFANDPFYNAYQKDGAFDSVSDDKMFDKIISDLTNQTKDQRKLIILTTLSTHTPYIVPWGAHKIDKAYAYSDMVIKNFIKKLEKINYFDNGIVVLTGDHVGWGANNRNDTDKVLLKINLHKLPMILINGKDHGIIVDNVSFSHTSLGVMLEYLMLPVYYKNKFQINPITEQNQNEYIFHYDDNSINKVYIKYGNKVDEILLDGDQTRFLGSDFSPQEQQQVLGYLSWVRR